MRIAIVLVLFLVGSVMADCTCECVDGKVVAVCESSIDLPPICPPRICPLDVPAIEPIKSPRVPPVGTTDCYQKRVYNRYTGRYEWKEICQ